MLGDLGARPALGCLLSPWVSSECASERAREAEPMCLLCAGRQARGSALPRTSAGPGQSPGHAGNTERRACRGVRYTLRA